MVQPPFHILPFFEVLIAARFPTALYIQTPTPPHPCNKQCLLSDFLFFPLVIIFLDLHKGAALSVGIPADEGRDTGCLPGLH